MVMFSEAECNFKSSEGPAMRIRSFHFFGLLWLLWRYNMCIIDEFKAESSTVEVCDADARQCSPSLLKFYLALRLK